MTDLTAVGFAEFTRAVHGRTPFAWQSDLTARVLAEGRWPDLVDVPTGLGKTSLLDIAVYVAAATVDHAGRHRLGRRRCFFVVDRRIVVDEAAEHARHLAERLTTAERSDEDGVVGDVARALRRYAPDAGGELLPVTVMRGGTTWASAWLDRPDRPGIVLGTVDQVGSRLLFRGYGVTPRRWSLDAALVGTDALLLVDEAHLATALLTTVDAAQRRDTSALPLPGLTAVRLTATGRPGQHSYQLDPDAHRDDPTAWARLTAGKRLSLRESTPTGCAEALATAALDQLAALTEAGAGGSSTGYRPTALVVCNTVDRARAVLDQLDKVRARGAGRRAAQQPARDQEPSIDLLIGRSRPVDRPDLQRLVLDRFGVARGPAEGPAILVATQTVEVGVNLDVDVLVTESASWDALVQRIGRVNRIGRLEQRLPGVEAAPVIVLHDGQADGPIYGTARDATWTALVDLCAAGDVDVSPLACRDLSTGALAGERYRREPVEVPVLLTPTLDAWVHTAPVPLNDPPIAPFLHGFDGGTAAVQVAWRSGLLSDDPLDDVLDEEGAEEASVRADVLLTELPPRTPELVAVPFIAVRQWLLGLSPEPVGDLELGGHVESKARQVREPFRALALRAPSGRRRDQVDATPGWRWITPGELRPGEVIVVPTERGGIDRYGWAPTDRTPVADATEAATFTPGRGTPPGVLIVDRGLPDRLGLTGTQHDRVTQAVEALIMADSDHFGVGVDSHRDAADRLSTLRAVLVEALAERTGIAAPPGWSPAAWERLQLWGAAARHVRLVRITDPLAGTVVGDGAAAPLRRMLVAAHPGVSMTFEPDDVEVAGSSVGNRQVTLDQHHDAVGRRAAQIAAALGLPDSLRAALERAARWHDLGKAEERFQIMLHAADACAAALAPEPLAKSGMDQTDRAALRLARRSSGLPPGARHEAWSLALVEEHLRQTGRLDEGDTDLVLHLVASHHGHARPFLPLVVDSSPRTVQAVVDGEKVTVPSERTVSLEHPGRFARLNQRYGRWGLSLLESVVRCADMTVSGEGS